MKYVSNPAIVLSFDVYLILIKNRLMMRILVIPALCISFLATSCAPKIGDATSATPQSSATNNGNNMGGSSNTQKNNNIFNDTEPGKIRQDK